MRLSARLVAVMAVLALTTLLLAPLQLLFIRFAPKRAARLPMLWQRVARRMLGLRVAVEGLPSEARPLLLVANHVSWLDIVTLGSVLPVSFIAKREVGEWPVVRHLARLQRSVFIDRARRQQTSAHGAAIAERLEGGDVLVLFAEGTTGDGIAVLPFRSALVGAAANALGARNAGAEGGAARPITLQPVAIAYTRLQGLPIGRLRMSDVAWHGDMDLAPHLAGLVGVGAIDAVVSFGEPVVFPPGGDRKAATAAAEAAVRASVRAIRARRGGATLSGALLTGDERG